MATYSQHAFKSNIPYIKFVLIINYLSLKTTITVALTNKGNPDPLPELASNRSSSVSPLVSMNCSPLNFSISNVSPVFRRFERNLIENVFT